MSTTYFTWTFPIQNNDSSPAKSVDDILAEMSSPVAVGHTLMSASRNGWLGYSLARIASSFDLSALNFLNNVGGTTQRDSSGYLWVISSLNDAAIKNASADIEYLLECAADNPRHFGSLLCDGDDAIQILNALHASSSDYDPIHGPTGEDEGDGPIYFFAYFKSLLSLLKHAKSHGLRVIHARYEHA